MTMMLDSVKINEDGTWEVVRGGGGDSALFSKFPTKRIPCDTRQECYRRARNRCEDCRQQLPLELHHLHYETVGSESPEDLACLCRDCHKKRHIDIGGNWWSDPQEMFWHWERFDELMTKDD